MRFQQASFEQNNLLDLSSCVNYPLSEIYNWKAYYYCYINFCHILNCKNAKEYCFAALVIEFE